jgi:hypothetical protein
MNDRYLFKAIDTNSVWRTGLLIALKGNRCAIEESDGSKWACDAKTLCQCTGLKDKNGKLIWENDILSGRLDEDYPEDETRKHILWHENGWHTKELGSIDYEPLDDFDSENFEVIGNVFDNPELLESEE